MHVTPPVTGFLAVPLLLASAALIAAAPHAPAKEGVELEVLGVVPLESESASLLVLRQKGAATVPPIFVGRGEAAAIQRRLAGDAASRPGAADLMERAIGALGGRVVRVEIEGMHAAVFRARVTLEQAQRRVVVDARPSDSVALAMSARAPIFASREVLAEAGLTKEDLERMHKLPERGEEETLAPSPTVTF
ncbi:MAG: bifunctional nuclease family protein [Anaeromyxobacteraceae bacterium]